MSERIESVHTDGPEGENTENKKKKGGVEGRGDGIRSDAREDGAAAGAREVVRRGGPHYRTVRQAHTFAIDKRRMKMKINTLHTTARQRESLSSVYPARWRRRATGAFLLVFGGRSPGLHREGVDELGSVEAGDVVVKGQLRRAGR